MESHEAELEALKYEVMTGWLLAMIVLSKQEMKYAARIWEKMNQKRAGETPFKYGE